MEVMEEKINRIKAWIRDADQVLLGVGEAMGVLPIAETDYKRIMVPQGQKRQRVLQAYNALYELVKDKSYFVVTMNTDDLIYESRFDQGQIVAPCGSVHMLQCRRHILERFETEEIFNRLKEHVQKGGSPEDETGVHILSCPACRELLKPNTIGNEDYLEDAYLPQWKEYTGWLSRTLNRRLCVLELGVSFAYPSIIRFPFEKTVYYNKKAALVRTDERFCQIPEEIKDKGIGIAANPIDFVLRLKED